MDQKPQNSDPLPQLLSNMDITTSTSASSYSLTTCSVPPQTVEFESECSIFDFHGSLFLDYGPQPPLTQLESEDGFLTASYIAADGVSPDANIYIPELSASPLQDDYSASASTPRIVIKEGLQQDPRFHDEIQTVSERRKARRRAQNRSAQHSFKERKKRREKELEEKVGIAERNFKALKVQNKQLKEDLDRRKKAQSGPISSPHKPSNSEPQDFGSKSRQ